MPQPQELTFNPNRGPALRDDGPRKKRLGLMKALIGTTHNIKLGDGRLRSFIVRDYRSFPKAQTSCVCLKCGKMWPTAEALLAAHPDHSIMAKQDEAHVIALWSEEAIKPEDLGQDEKGKPAKPTYSQMIGFLSDEHPHQE
jgi:hypothetical protein